MTAPTSNKPQTKVTVKVSIVVKRAKTEFKKGMGVGVLASQEIVFDIDADGPMPTGALLAAMNLGEDLMRDAVEVKYEVIE
jgi:hypothetical protein